MLSHPGGYDKPIPEIIHIWHHRTSTPNNLEKSRLVCVLDIFCTFLDKNEKNNQSQHWGRDSGIPSSYPRFATCTTRLANLGHSNGISSSLPQCGVRFYDSICWESLHSLSGWVKISQFKLRQTVIPDIYNSKIWQTLIPDSVTNSNFRYS